MKKAASEYVFMRDNGIYCFRRSVPLDIRDEVGKNEWKVSLRTKDKALANKKAAVLSQKINNQIAQHRGEALAETAIDPGAPASNDQVVAALERLLARDRTIRTGRLDGRIENDAIEGSGARDLLERLIEELNELERATPLALDQAKLDRFMPRLERETARVPQNDKKLMRKLAASYLQNEKQVIEIKIAQLRGDEDALERISKKTAKERDLSFLVDLYKKHRGAQWRAKTQTKIENISRVMLDILGAQTKISSVNREMAREFSDVLHSLPTNYSKRKSLSGLSARAAAEKAQSLGLPTLGYKSVRIYLSYAKSMFEFAVNEELISRNPMRGLISRVPFERVSSKIPTPLEIQTMFSAPLFVGCVDDVLNWRKPGPKQVRRGRFWVPVLALHTGMRLGEICSLQAKDIQILHDVRLFNLVDNEERRLKTKNAARVIPIHKRLEEIGFVDWLEHQSLAPEDFLFAELPVTSAGNRSDAFTKWFGRFRKSVGLSGKQTSIHGLRHLFSDLLLETNPGKINHRRVLGWAQDDMLDVYGDGKTIKLFDHYVQKIDFGEYDIAHLVR